MKKIIAVNKWSLLGVIAVALTVGFGCNLPARLMAPKINRYPDMNKNIPYFLATHYSDQANPAVIKGKVAVAIRADTTADGELDRFTRDGMFSDLPSGGFLPPELYAKTPDEVNTLVVVLCSKTTESGLFQDDAYQSRFITFEKVECPTTVYDYRARKLIANKTFSAGGKSASVYVKRGEDRVKAEIPKDDIRKFLEKIPRDQ